jgi:nicotinic acid phosphoribosyltransferase
MSPQTSRGVADFATVSEAPWTAEYILLLRKGLDAAGLQHVKITAADGGTDVIAAAAKSPELAAAIDSFGIHTHLLSPDADINRWGGEKMYHLRGISTKAAEIILD